MRARGPSTATATVDGGPAGAAACGRARGVVFHVCRVLRSPIRSIQPGEAPPPLDHFGPEVILALLQDQGEGGPLADGALGGQGAAVQLGQLPGQRKPDAGTAPAAPFDTRGLEEPLEDARQVDFRYARAVVAHFDDRPLVVASHANHDPPPGGRVVEGVCDEVGQNALDTVGVPENDGGGRRRLDPQVDSPCLRCRLRPLPDRPRERRQVEGGHVEAQAPHVDPRQVQQLADVLEQTRRVSPHHVEKGSLLHCRRLQEQLLDGGEDQGQRRPELMGDIGEEVVVEPAHVLDPEALLGDALEDDDRSGDGEREDDEEGDREPERRELLPHAQERVVEVVGAEEEAAHGEGPTARRERPPRRRQRAERRVEEGRRDGHRGRQRDGPEGRLGRRGRGRGHQARRQSRGVGAPRHAEVDERGQQGRQGEVHEEDGREPQGDDEGPFLCQPLGHEAQRRRQPDEEEQPVEAAAPVPPQGRGKNDVEEDDAGVEQQELADVTHRPHLLPTTGYAKLSTAAAGRRRERTVGASTRASRNSRSSPLCGPTRNRRA